VAKAFGAGADFVMAGGMFAGHDQCGGDIIQRNGRKFKLFYGMSSATAMEKHAGRVAEYRYSCSHLIVHVSKPAGLAHECLKYVES
jgi:GMP reductase